MTKKNKRPHKADDKADTPIMSNSKKQDDKKTPTKTNPIDNDDELIEFVPKTLMFDNIDQAKTSDDTTTAKKIIVNKGFTSTEWGASGLRCRNDKMHATASRDPATCNICKGWAHTECLCENECLTCNKNIVWNSYSSRWIKIITSTTSNKDSSLQKASSATNNNINQQSLNSIKVFGEKMWCGGKLLCRNNNVPADGTKMCTICLEAVHMECIDAGEDDVEYICVGCNTKNTLLTIEPPSSAPDKNDNIITMESDITTTQRKNTTMSQPSAQMEVEEDIPLALDITLGTIKECEQTVPTKKKKTKPQVAPGAGRITKQMSSRTIPPRPNRSSQKGDFFITRLELRVCLAQATTNETNIQKLHRHLVEIATELTSVDNDLKFIPWKNQQVYEEITAQQVPNHQPGINKFFNRAYPKTDGLTYADLQIKHKRPAGDIINDIALWLSNRQHGLYFQTLQCEEVSNIGWLLWSFRKIDLRKLEDEIWELYKINIALKYQAIAVTVNRGRPQNNNGREIVKALHIWTKQSDAARAIKLFNFDVYKDTAIHFPLGIVLRFIPHISQLTTDKRRALHQSAWDLQRIFLNGIETNRFLTATSWEIASLDRGIDSLDSLRKLIMGVESKKRINEHLFLSVDYSYFRTTEVIFSFLPRHEQEAREFVANLVPYILNTHPADGVKSYFHADAVDRALNSYWDDNSKEVVSFFDKYLDDFEILDDYAEDFEGDHQQNNDVAIIQTMPTGPMSRVERIITGEESDSIGTLLTNPTTQYPSTLNNLSSISLGDGINNTNSSLSTMVQSAAPTMSPAQMETNIVFLHKSMSTIESVVLLIAQNMKLDVSKAGLQVSDQSSRAAASDNEVGCKDK
jgi:hypothetical protein